MRVALVHDWLTGMRGGEKVFEVFCEMYPDADVFTLLHIPGTVSKTIERHTIHTSFIQRAPFKRTKYRNYLPLFPTAIEQFDLRGYDLVLSSSHCVAKGVITHPGTCHLSYVHTPMRYVWDMYHEYFGGSQSRLKRLVIPPASNYLRIWDVTSAARVDEFVANSHHVAERVLRHYQRPSTVINPPVDTDFFDLSHETGDYFLIVSALAPYKRIDLAIETFNRLELPLKIVGTGEHRDRLEALAGRTVELLGWQSDEAVRDLYRGCRAFVFPQEEDFGITPLEAQACGKPVLAYGKGGALETVLGISSDTDRFDSVGSPDATAPTPNEPTGIFFPEQTVEALAGAIELFEKSERYFDPETIRSHALSFSRPLFRTRMEAFVEAGLERFHGTSQRI